MSCTPGDSSAAERQDRPAAIGDELLTDMREEPPDEHARVFGAVVLAEVAGAEREDVGDLAAVGIDHPDAVPGPVRPPAPREPER